MKALGYFDGIVDGWFGPKFEAAVRKFQEFNLQSSALKLQLAVDGKIGPKYGEMQPCPSQSSLGIFFFW